MFRPVSDFQTVAHHVFNYVCMYVCYECICILKQLNKEKFNQAMNVCSYERKFTVVCMFIDKVNENLHI